MACHAMGRCSSLGVAACDFDAAPNDVDLGRTESDISPVPAVIGVAMFLLSLS